MFPALNYNQPMRSRLERAFRFALDNTLLMVAGAVIALVWANLHPDSYARLTDTLRFAVNDVAMVFFFGLATKEIVAATAPGGPLHSPRHAALPVLAAIGGMAGPALLYVALGRALSLPEITRGWAIPCATDIAFSYLVVRLIFGPHHPAVPFLLLLAIADDAMGLALLAGVYPSGPVHLVRFTALLGAACIVAWQFRRWKVRSFWPYIAIPGAISWSGWHLGGLHPALALVPIIPFLPRAPHETGLFTGDGPREHGPLNAFERWWSTPVEVILFFFALINAGVAFGRAGPTTWIVLAALGIGKPVGIVVTTWLAERAGLHRPAQLSWRDLLVLGTAAGIGFTVALFFATAAFGPGLLLDQAKLGALLSVGTAAVTFALARLLRVGRLAN